MKKLILLTLLFFSILAYGQQRIEFVASASAGGPTDTITRRVAQIIHDETDIKLLVLNKPGAAHTIAYRYIADSDKPTLIISTPEVLKHEVIEQLSAIHTIGRFSIHIMVNKNSPINTFEDIIRLSKSRDIVFGNSGINTYSHIGMSKVCKDDIKCLAVQFKSASEGITSLMGNHIDAYALVSFGATAYLQHEKLKSIHVIKDKTYTITMYSKNVSKEVSDRIKQILIKELDSEFYKSMEIEKVHNK